MFASIMHILGKVD